jgi:hypothetical protein
MHLYLSKLLPSSYWSGIGWILINTVWILAPKLPEKMTIYFAVGTVIAYGVVYFLIKDNVQFAWMFEAQ